MGNWVIRPVHPVPPPARRLFHWVSVPCSGPFSSPHHQRTSSLSATMQRCPLGATDLYWSLGFGFGFGLHAAAVALATLAWCPLGLWFRAHSLRHHLDPPLAKVHRHAPLGSTKDKQSLRMTISLQQSVRKNKRPTQGNLHKSVGDMYTKSTLLYIPWDYTSMATCRVSNYSSLAPNLGENVTHRLLSHGDISVQKLSKNKLSSQRYDSNKSSLVKIKYQKIVIFWESNP